MAGDAPDRPPGVAGGESTYVEPDRVQTIDGRSEKARAQRAVPAPAAAVVPAAGANVEAVSVGRFHLLELVGSGGMGLVWGAWDPELERRVALKLMKPTLAASRDRMLSEGQSLAKLSHPNVVPIYDVGVIGEQVYLVMEWVRGETLRGFADTEPSVEELLAAYRQAGEGLAAAHRAGVIHRDFKPDNAIRGDDSRVRVLDFGLARSSSGAGDGHFAGTLRYAAPEQQRGDALTPAVDQYAFCVSLREGLEARGGVPTWIEPILARGTADDPVARWPTMDDVLAALANDPARRWRRRAAIAAVAVVVAGAFAIGRARGSDAVALEPCTGGAAELAPSWNPGARTAMAAHLHSLGPLQPAEITRVADDLDGYATRWVGEHHRTCLARERREQSPERLAVRETCLVRSRSALRTVGELLTTVESQDVPNALVAARSLPDAQLCAELDAIEIAPPPAAVAGEVQAIASELERVRMLVISSRPESRGLALEVVARARATHYQPLVARALVVAGRAEQMAERDEWATVAFAEATTTALRVSDDSTAVEAFARWIYAGRSQASPLGNWTVMEQIATRLGADGRFLRALLYNLRAVASLVGNDRVGAREMLEIARRESRGSTDPELIYIDGVAALVEPDPAIGEQLAWRGAKRFTEVLGATHPAALTLRLQAALMTRDAPRALRELAVVCPELERWRTPVAAADCQFEAGLRAFELGRNADAARWMSRAVFDPLLRDGGRPQGFVAAQYLTLALGPPSAVPAVARELERLAHDTRPLAGWWMEVSRAEAALAAATAWSMLGDAPAAERNYATALRILGPIDHAPYAGRIAAARAGLAELRQRRAPHEAARFAWQALGWLRGSPHDADRVARLEAIAAWP